MISVQVGTGLTFGPEPKPSLIVSENISRPLPGEKPIHYGDMKSVVLRGKFRFSCTWRKDLPWTSHELLILDGKGATIWVHVNRPEGKRISRWDRRLKRRTFQAFPSQLRTIIERHLHEYLDTRENNYSDQRQRRHRARLRARAR